MVERVREAIERALSGRRDPARAAIQAMREPTAHMLNTVVPLPVHLIVERDDPEYTRQMGAATFADQATTRSQYQQFIDAALSEEG